MKQNFPEELKISTSLEVIQDLMEEGSITITDIDDMIEKCVPEEYLQDTVAGRLDEIGSSEHTLLKEWKLK